MARARAEIEAERVDKLAEAERRARLLRETDGAHWVGLPPILDELDRLRPVEQAATALVEHWEVVDHSSWDDLDHFEDLLDALAAAVHGETK
jgi:hypothetical protein